MRSEIIDGDTCDTCIDVDGVMLRADDSRWAGELGMPMHCNCRYDLIPIIEGIDPVMTATSEIEIPQLIQRMGAIQTKAMIAAMRIPTRGANRFAAKQLKVEDLFDVLEPADLILRLFGVE
ncbi:hypothetical protein ES707_20137 [subsurface metagenome]